MFVLYHFRFERAKMVQLNLEAAHPVGTDGLLAGAASSALARASGPTKRSSLAHAQKSILPLHHFKPEVVLGKKSIYIRLAVKEFSSKGYLVDVRRVEPCR